MEKHGDTITDDGCVAFTDLMVKDPNKYDSWVTCFDQNETHE